MAIAVLEKDESHFEGAFGEGIAVFIVEAREAFFGEFGEVDFPSVIGKFFGIDWDGGRGL